MRWRRTIIRLEAQFFHVLRHSQVLQSNLLLGLAVLVGVGGGCGAVYYRELIEALRWIFYDWGYAGLTDASPVARFLLPLAPACGAALVYLVTRLAAEARGEGVPLILATSREVSGREPAYELNGEELKLTIFGRPAPGLRGPSPAQDEPAS